MRTLRIERLRQIAYEILRDLKREGPVTGKKDMVVKANPNVIDFLKHAENGMIQNLETNLSRKIHLKSQNTLHIEQFEVSTK